MTDTENTNLVLYRCKTMNCVYEGQAFSVRALHGELGGREATDATITAMVDAHLISHGANGTFILTGAGAAAISELPVKRRSYTKSGTWQSKKTVDQSSS